MDTNESIFELIASLVGLGKDLSKFGIREADICSIGKDPTKIEWLCRFTKNLALGKNTLLPDINNFSLYSTLGMLPQLKEAIESLSLPLCLSVPIRSSLLMPIGTITKEPLPDSKYWYLLMVKGITCSKVISAMEKLGVKCSFHFKDTEALDSYDISRDKKIENDREPNRDGSYLVKFLRKTKPENMSNEQRRNIKECTILEFLVLLLGYFLTSGGHLLEGSTATCGSSYLGQWRWLKGEVSETKISFIVSTSGEKSFSVGTCPIESIENRDPRQIFI